MGSSTAISSPVDSKEIPEVVTDGEDQIAEDKAPEAVMENADDEDEFPGWRKLVFILTALYLSMFIVALDRTIIGTAIPRITDEFHSIGDVGWYASAYILTTSAFQLIYGRIFTFYSPKWVLLIAIGIFEVGSAVCGAAPSSKAFIVGRAVAGLGGAGIFCGVIIIMVISIPLRKRPMFQGIFGAVFGISSVAGPLLGGVFTTDVTWRWCFYINLPCGAVVVAILIFILHVPRKNIKMSMKETIKKLDPYGTFVFLPGIVCLLLALQWGGTIYAWKDARIIVLFILAGILIGLFIYDQFKQGDNATVPIRIIKQRSVASGFYYSIFSGGSMLSMIYYLPLYFQAIKGVSAIRSGLNTLPLVLSLVVASIIAGALTSRTGYYVPQLITGCVLMSIGAGLITMFQVDTPHPKWIGYQIVYGFGLGLGMQQSAMAAQTCLSKNDVMSGVALMFFGQGLGGSIFVSISETVFTHTLSAKLSNFQGLDPKVIVNTGATQLRSLVAPQFLGEVINAYDNALQDAFKVSLACACCTVLGSLTMEWVSVKGKDHGGPTMKKSNDEKPGDLESGVMEEKEI
ncbi:putative MFS multidrug transporter [Xylogone sp. PMI_703]|nr:putative MFS multidrug transporter [Xylogone sp. PMI_703]